MIQSFAMVQGVEPLEEEVLPLGLVMMVKNEADYINQTLASVKPFVDFWTIVDTGAYELSCGHYK